MTVGGKSDVRRSPRRALFDARKEALQMELRDSRDYLEPDEAEVRAEGDEGKERIKGLGIVYSRWSQNLGGFKERIQPGAATEALAKSDIRSLFNHNPDRVLGRLRSGTLELEETDRGVHYT